MLQDAPVLRSAPIGCIGAGTGLGECFVTPNDDGFFTAWPSEGGHAEFAPRNDLEFELLVFLKKKFEQVAGIHYKPNVYMRTPELTFVVLIEKSNFCGAHRERIWTCQYIRVFTSSFP